MQRVRVYSPEELAATISAIAARDVDQPSIRRTALAVVGRHDRDKWPTLLRDYVLRATRWVPERGEVVEAPADVLRFGAADCDGLTTLYLALAWCVGLEARPVLVGDHGQPVHALPEVKTRDGWRMVEVSHPTPRKWRHAWRNTRKDNRMQIHMVGGACCVVGADPPRGDRTARWCTTPDGSERWREGPDGCACPNIPVPTNRAPEPWEVETQRAFCEGRARPRYRAAKKKGGGTRYGAKTSDLSYRPGGEQQGAAPSGGGGFPWWLLLVAYELTRKKK